MGDDPFHLQRFVEAQAEVYAEVCAELAAGQKRTHWIWFIFPQMKGLGHSSTAQQFGIGSLDEARAYLRHPVLGDRLRECTRLVNGVVGKELSQVLGYSDDLKFRSSMTLFAQAADAEDEADDVFAQALGLWFDGASDVATLDRL